MKQTLCWRNLAHLVIKKIEKPTSYSFKAWYQYIHNRYFTTAEVVETVYFSPFGYLSTQSGIVNLVSKNGSEFLRTIYGYTSSHSDGITGQIFYEGYLLSPSEILTLFSYINHDTWLCGSLTVEEYVKSTIDLNQPSWV